MPKPAATRADPVRQVLVEPAGRSDRRPRAEVGGPHRGIGLDLVGGAGGDHRTLVEAHDLLADPDDEPEVVVDDDHAGLPAAAVARTARSSPATRSRTCPRWARRGAGTPARRGGTGQLQLPGAAVVELLGGGHAGPTAPRGRGAPPRSGGRGRAGGGHRPPPPPRCCPAPSATRTGAGSGTYARAPPGEPVRRQLRDELIVERDLARGRLDQSRDDVEQRGLAALFGPMRPRTVSFSRHRRAAQRREATEPDGDVLGPQGGGRWCRSRDGWRRGRLRRRRQRLNHQRSSSQSSSSPDGRRIMKPSIAPPRKISVSPSRSSQSSPGTFTSGPAR